MKIKHIGFRRVTAPLWFRPPCSGRLRPVPMYIGTPRRAKWGPFLALLLFCSFVILAPCFLAPAFAGVNSSPRTQGQESRGGSEEPDEGVALIIDILRSDEPEIRSVAMSMVREMPGTEVTKALIRELPNLSIAGQIQLLSALADRGDHTALPVVITATKADDPSVRIAALKALGQLGDASCVTLLAQIAANSSAEEQQAARESLYRLRGLDVDKAILAEILTPTPPLSSFVRQERGEDVGVKVELIRSMGERNITAGVQTLLKTAQEPDSKVQRESFRVLKIIADEKYLPAMVELLLKIESASVRSEAQKSIAAVAHKIEDKNRQAEAVLAVLPEVSDVKDRCSLLNVLGRIGDDSALPALREAVSSGHGEEQDAAIRALSDWPNPKPLNDLLKAASTSGRDPALREPNHIHRILALRGFVRLLGLESDRHPEETIKMYEQAMSLAPSMSEKRMVLSGLANVKSLSALQIAAGYLEDKALQTEAEVAVIKIAEGIYGSYPQQTKDVLNSIIQASRKDSVRQQARNIVKQISEFPP